MQKIFSQLAGAVSYVHRQSCVHRDLKLENILLDKSENVKLVDFGFTREYEGKTNYLQTFCGTICYSAPEMLRGEKYAGEKVDVWSLGVILYALLCGELPFDDDDDHATRKRILTEEPKYPVHLHDDAKSLVKLLLSKRTLMRPSLSDILGHAFLADHAPAQQAIFKSQQPQSFSSPVEQETLQRMKLAGVSIDAVIESVLSQRCDALAGWWALLVQKEERKVIRRERKRQEKDAEARNSRRLSATSSKLERLTPVLKEVSEETTSEGTFNMTMEPPTPGVRGRPPTRSSQHTDVVAFDIANWRCGAKVMAGPGGAEGGIPPPPIEKDIFPPARSASTSRHRPPVPPPKECVLRSARSRGSTLHLVTTSDVFGLGEPPDLERQEERPRMRKKRSQIIMAHWKNWTHWFYENTRRHKSQNRRGSQSTPNLVSKNTPEGTGDEKDASPRPHTGAGQKSTTIGGNSGYPSRAGARLLVNGRGGRKPLPKDHDIGPANGTLYTHFSQSNPPRQISASKSSKRQSLSPSPLTPRSTIRRSSTGLRGRKSTSSSVSSIRSLHHHHHTHSKASSTSSGCSISTSMSKTAMQRSHSPHHSVKIIAATTTPGTTLPSNIRLVRAVPAPLSFINGRLGYENAQQPLGSPNPFTSTSSGNILFTKRKRNLFKGPTLNFSSHGSRASGSGSHSRNASAGGMARESGEITIKEEDEEEEHDLEDEEVEEVDVFSPVVSKRGEHIEERFIRSKEQGARPKQEHDDMKDNI